LILSLGLGGGSDGATEGLLTVVVLVPMGTEGLLTVVVLLAVGLIGLPVGGAIFGTGRCSAGTPPRPDDTNSLSERRCVL
jgi:hypothetical protein